MQPIMSTGGNYSSSSPNSNPNLTPTEESPRRRRSGSSSPNSTEEGPRRRRGGSSAALVMGIPGQSAFRPYRGPTHPHSSAPGSSSRPSGSGGPSFGGGLGFASFAGGFGFQTAQAIPVGGSGSGSGSGGGAPLRIGGNPTVRKRVREGGAARANQPVEAGGNVVNCSLCGRGFNSPKALFGHMRSHPDRGWKGAHPPPVFRAEEEFADLRGGDRPEVVVGAGAGGGEEAEAGNDAAEEEEEEAEGYRLPDLNNPPPSEK